MSSPPPTGAEKDDLLLSCRFGELEDVQIFVELFGAEYLSTIRDDNNNTILHMICGNGHLDLLDFVLPLIEPWLLRAQNNAGSTALHWAALNLHMDVMKRLVLFPSGPGIDLIDIKNGVGRSPLAEAELSGWDEGAKWLVEKMNLESDSSGIQLEESEGANGSVDASDIEIQIEDADGQVAKMTISGGTVNTVPKAVGDTSTSEKPVS